MTKVTSVRRRLIKHRKGKYYSLLKDTDAEINCGDLTPFVCGFLEFVADTIYDINRKLKHKISQLERFRRLLSKVIPENGIKAVIMDLLLQADAFYGLGLTMYEIMSLTGKSRNTIKGKFANLPVRTVKAISRRKKFYKIDWNALRNLLRYG